MNRFEFIIDSHDTHMRCAPGVEGWLLEDLGSNGMQRHKIKLSHLTVRRDGSRIWAVKIIGVNGLVDVNESRIRLQPEKK